MRYAEHEVTAEDEAAVLRVLRSRFLTQGPEVEAFEAELAKYVGAKHAVAVSSGTAALHVAYLAANAKVVLTSPLSFVATANAALLAGAAVGFFDIGETPHADPHQDSCPPIGSAYVPVHYGGRPSPVITLRGFGGEVPVVEDACHALGADDFDGCSKVGSCAHSLATVFSFHPAKHITTGEGGAVTTNDDACAERLRRFRSHGRDDLGYMQALGLNYRMSEVAAALGRSQLRRIDDIVERRFQVARWYTMAFDLAADAAGEKRPRGQVVGRKSAWHLYTKGFTSREQRDMVRANLAAAGIQAQVHYYPIIPLQPYYRRRFGHEPGTFPNAEDFAASTLSLPMYPTMNQDDVQRVVDATLEAMR